MKTFFAELAERMFNFVYENYLMWIKVTKYNEKRLLKILTGLIRTNLAEIKLFFVAMRTKKLIGI